MMKPRAGFNWWEAWGEMKIEGFGGRPPFGGRPGALGPMLPPKSGPDEAAAKLTTANGRTFTSSSARLSSQSRYCTLDQ